MSHIVSRIRVYEPSHAPNACIAAAHEFESARYQSMQEPHVCSQDVMICIDIPGDCLILQVAAKAYQKGLWGILLCLQVACPSSNQELSSKENLPCSREFSQQSWVPPKTLKTKDQRHPHSICCVDKCLSRRNQKNTVQKV